MRPNFLGIGAPRCGTTWIHRLLESHPEVFVPRRKEIHFFDLHYEKGIAWYERAFERASLEKAVGEITPAYLSTPTAEIRIKQVLGHIRLFSVLRQPAQRAYSHYLNELAARRQQGKSTNISFQAMVKKLPRILEEGFYCRMLERYLAEFSRARLLILFYDDIDSHPQTVWHTLCQHLDIATTHNPRWLDERANTSRDRHGRFRAVQKAQKAFEKVGAFTISKLLGKLNANPIPSIPAALKSELNSLYESDIRALEKVAKRDLAHWLF